MISSSFTFPVRLCAPLDQPDGVLGELAQGVHELHDLVHDDYGAGLKNGEGKSDVWVEADEDADRKCLAKVANWWVREARKGEKNAILKVSGSRKEWNT